VSNGSSGELRLAKMEPTFYGFLEVAHTISFSAALAAIFRSLSLLSFKSVPRQGEKNIFPVIETFNVQAAIAIQKRTQATVKT
jgi:hypothetical protein